MQIGRSRMYDSVDRTLWPAVLQDFGVPPVYHAPRNPPAP